MAFQSFVSFPKSWATCEEVPQVLPSIVTRCVLNQSYKHWLLRHVLQYVIIKTHEIDDKLAKFVVTNKFANFKKYIYKTNKFTIHMKHEMLDVFILSFHFFMGLIGKKIIISF
jgi:hypothetical protein